LLSGLSSCDDLTIVIPVKDERDGLKLVLEEIVESGFDLSKVIVVDGGSRDGTREVAESYGVMVVQQRYPGGKAGGVRTGLELARTSYVVVLDGDYTYPALHIWDLCRKLDEGYDLVIGVRRPQPGAMGPLFKLGNIMLTTWFNLIFGTRLRDVLSGMYAIRVEALREAMWEAGGFSVESEIVAHIASTTGRIAEVDIVYRSRVGEKKLKPVHGVKILADMVRLSWSYNPIFTLFTVTSLILIPGVALDVYYLYHLVFNDVKYYMKGLLGAIMTIVGLQTLGIAVLALYMKRMEFRLRRAIERALRNR
jgi:glycosyltransferase involved in cell wall biosynthesis